MYNSYNPSSFSYQVLKNAGADVPQDVPGISPGWGVGMPFNQSEASPNDYKYATGVNMVRNAIKGMYGWLTNPFGNSKSTINQENNLQSRVN